MSDPTNRSSDDKPFEGNRMQRNYHTLHTPLPSSLHLPGHLVDNHLDSILQCFGVWGIARNLRYLERERKRKYKKYLLHMLHQQCAHECESLLIRHAPLDTHTHTPTHAHTHTHTHTLTHTRTHSS